LHISGCNAAPALAGLALILMAGCMDAPRPEPEDSTQQARALAAAGPVKIILGTRADLTLADAAVVTRGPWGTGPGRFGKDDEATRPGPMSLAVDRQGTVFVLDQVNRRVQRFSRHGSRLPAMTGLSETTEDIALHHGQVWALEYVPHDGPRYAVTRRGARGADLTVLLDRERELATGLFVTGPAATPDVRVEQRQDTLLRVVREGAALAPARQTHHVLGRPNRGQPGHRVTARLTGTHTALVMTVDPEVGARPAFEVSTPIPLVAIQELDTDADGAIYVGLFLATEGPAPDFAWEQVRKVVVAWRPGAGHRVVEMQAIFATTVFRPVAVGQDGALYQLHTTEQEVLVRRWAPVFGPREVRP